MLTIVSGRRLLGFGGVFDCPKCHNRVVEHVFMPFTETGAMYFAFDTVRLCPESICPVCHLVVRDFAGGDILEVNTESLAHCLDIGKDMTLRHYRSLSWLERKKYHRDLRKLRLFRLLAYLEERTS